MAKVVYEQFDGGLQKDWYKTTSTNRAYKNQNKNGIAFGCVNPFLQEGVLIPGHGSRTSVENESTITGGTNNITSFVVIGDGNFQQSLPSIYFGQDDDFHGMVGATVQTTGWPQTLGTPGTHGSHSVQLIEKIVDYQVNGVRKQLIFWRDDVDWDCSFYSGIEGSQGTVTMTQANPGVFSKAYHKLSNGDVVRIIGGTLPTNIVSGTNYYVISSTNADLASATFQLSATKGGAAIDTTAGTNSGTHTLYPGLQTTGMSLSTGYSANMILNRSTSPRPIIAVASDNGFCYFGNGKYLHKFDGTTAGGANGTITGAVLELSKHREIIDIVDGLGKLWILTRDKTPSSSATVYAGGSNPSVLVWNRISSTVSIEDNIPVNAQEASAIYIHNGVVYVWGKVQGSINKLFSYTGKAFSPIEEIGSIVTNSEIGYVQNEIGLPSRLSSSIISYNNGFMWSDRLSNVFWYGSTNPLKIAPTCYWISRISNADGNSGGALLGAGSSSFPLVFTTHSIGSVVKLSYFSPTEQTDTNSGTTIYTSAVELPKLSTIDGVTVFFNENTVVDTGTTTMKVYNSWKKNSGAYLVTKTIDHDVDIPRGWVYFPMSMINSNLVQISFTLNGTSTIANSPQITRIEVDYTATVKKK